MKLYFDFIVFNLFVFVVFDAIATNELNVGRKEEQIDKMVKKIASLAVITYQCHLYVFPICHSLLLTKYLLNAFHGNDNTVALYTNLPAKMYRKYVIQ